MSQYNSARVSSDRFIVIGLHLWMLLNQVVGVVSGLWAMDIGIGNLCDRGISGGAFILHIVLNHFAPEVDVADICDPYIVILCRIDVDVAAQQCIEHDDS